MKRAVQIALVLTLMACGKTEPSTTIEYKNIVWIMQGLPNHLSYRVVFGETHFKDTQCGNGTCTENVVRYQIDGNQIRFGENLDLLTCDWSLTETTLTYCNDTFTKE